MLTHDQEGRGKGGSGQKEEQGDVRHWREEKAAQEIMKHMWTSEKEAEIT